MHLHRGIDFHGVGDMYHVLIGSLALFIHVFMHTQVVFDGRIYKPAGSGSSAGNTQPELRQGCFIWPPLLG
jgi:hypothetical protein